MKNILFISAILLMSLSSCEDYLEVEATNEIAIKGIEDIKALQSAYVFSLKNPVPYPYKSYLQRPAGNHFFYPSGEENVMFAYYTKDMSPDNYQTQNSYYLGSKFFKDCMRWNNTPGHTEIWNANYENIGFQNEVIYELENLDLEKDDQWKEFYAESKIMRAYLIFKTFQFFSTFNNPESGIPLNLDPQNIVGSKKTRWTQQEIYDQIFKELQDIVDLDIDANEDYNVFYRRNIIDAILAQVYQYKGTGPCKEDTDWANARTHAEKAIEGKYLTTTFEELDALFTSNDQRGVVQYDNPGAGIIFNWGNKATGGLSQKTLNSGEYYIYSERYCVLPHSEMLELYADTDHRRERYFDEYTYDTPSVHTVTMANKTTIVGWYVAFYHPMFRTAEMKLLIAETYAREGDEGQATAILQEFKTSRNAGPIIGSVLDEILIERRKEFFCEGDYRWLDMKRNGMTSTNKYKTGEGSEELSFDLASDDFRYAFKIPMSSEINYNFQLTQNPGWDTFNE